MYWAISSAKCPTWSKPKCIGGRLIMLITEYSSFLVSKFTHFSWVQDWFVLVRRDSLSIPLLSRMPEVDDGLLTTWMNALYMYDPTVDNIQGCVFWCFFQELLLSWSSDFHTFIYLQLIEGFSQDSCIVNNLIRMNNLFLPMLQVRKDLSFCHGL